ncbi:hypothetical protein C8J57DRAFT_1529065 [Mycena rebaudengoi]|nr:hypothetical protein C8J57DRAFT_1529065 [Mycena rebaudengoi]
MASNNPPVQPAAQQMQMPLQPPLGPTYVQGPPATQVSPQPSPTRTPVKQCGPGRPRKTDTATRAKDKEAPTTTTSPKLKRGLGRPRGENSRPKKRVKPSEKENEPAAKELADDGDLDDENLESSKRWTNENKTRVFNFILGQTDEGDRRFEQHKKSPAHVYIRASEILFAGKRSADSIKSLYTRSLNTFTWIIAFEGFTGNGGGDPDSDDPTAILSSRLSAARTAGLVVGSLKPATIQQWEDNGWRDLFNDRLGASAKVSWQVPRNSA